MGTPEQKKKNKLSPGAFGGKSTNKKKADEQLAQLKTKLNNKAGVSIAQGVGRAALLSIGNQISSYKNKLSGGKPTEFKRDTKKD